MTHLGAGEVDEVERRDLDGRLFSAAAGRPDRHVAIIVALLLVAVADARLDHQPEERVRAARALVAARRRDGPRGIAARATTG